MAAVELGAPRDKLDRAEELGQSIGDQLMQKLQIYGELQRLTPGLCGTKETRLIQPEDSNT